MSMRANIRISGSSYLSTLILMILSGSCNSRSVVSQRSGVGTCVAVRWGSGWIQSFYLQLIYIDPSTMFLCHFLVVVISLCQSCNLMHLPLTQSPQPTGQTVLIRSVSLTVLGSGNLMFVIYLVNLISVVALESNLALYSALVSCKSYVFRSYSSSYLSSFQS
jgi:hypothetical protein